MIKQFIRQLRTEEKANTGELTRGLCSVERLRKYERGEKELEKLQVDALWQRLGGSAESFEIYLDQDEYGLACERTRIQVLIRKGELEQAEQRLRAYEKKQGAGEKLHRQFVLLQRTEIARRRRAPHAEQLRLVMEALSQTLDFSYDSPEILREHRFDVLELLLLERYAFLLEDTEPETAVRWYRELCRYLGWENAGEERKDGGKNGGKDTPKRQRPNYDVSDSCRLLPPVFYRLAVRAWKAGLYQTALEYAREGGCMAGRGHACLPLFVMLEEQKQEAMQKRGEEPPQGEAGCLKLLKEWVCEHPAWLENIYPDYAERNLLSVNEVLRERRLANLWSEEEMALDCDVRTIKSAESKRSMLQPVKKKQLFKMLRLTTVKYSGELITARYSDFRDAVEMIRSYDAGSCEHAEEIYKRIREGLGEDEVVNRRFIRYWDVRFEYGKKKLPEKAYRKAMWELLGEALPHLEDTGAQCAFSGYEREILRELAWTAEESEVELLEYILCAQYKKVRDDMALSGLFAEYEESLASCIGNIFCKQGKPAVAAGYLDSALGEMYFMQEDLRLGELLFQRFRAEEDFRREKGMPRLSKDDEEIRWVRLAYATYKIYVKKKAWAEYIEKYLDRNYGDKKSILQELL